MNFHGTAQMILIAVLFVIAFFDAWKWWLAVAVVLGILIIDCPSEPMGDATGASVIERCGWWPW